MRWLYAATKPEQNLHFGYGLGKETRRRFLIPLWNVYSFLVTYANLDGWSPAGKLTADTVTLKERTQSPIKSNDQLDRWILARLDETTLEVTRRLEAFTADKATIALENLLDDLSNWYVRRSRRRFWKSEADADKMAAYETLYSAVLQLAKLLAPFVPFTAEAIYQNLVHEVEPAAPLSVHHNDWPAADAKTLNRQLLNKMRLAINVAGLGRSARSAASFKLRQPLSRARINVGASREQQDLLELAEVLKEEINVKEIEVVSEVGELVSYKLLPNNRQLGPKYGRLFPKIRAALSELDQAAAATKLQSGEELVLDIEGQQVALSGEEVLVQTESRGGLAVASDKGVTVAVDTSLTPDLIREGYARDLVRAINTLRKNAGLALDDRIRLTYQAEGELAQTFVQFGEYIQQETLAVELSAGSLESARGRETLTIGESQVRLSLDVA
jgi:isoleucyl-tRNA synthetase